VATLLKKLKKNNNNKEINEIPVYHTRVLEKGTREEHAIPATRPAAYKKNFGKIGWLLLLLVCNKVA
jgi:hypothetical protein